MGRVNAIHRHPTRRLVSSVVLPVGAGGAATAAAAACLCSPPALLNFRRLPINCSEEGEFPARCRGRSGNRIDRSRVLYPFVIDCLDNSLVVKADDIYLLVQYIRFEESGLARFSDLYNTRTCH